MTTTPVLTFNEWLTIARERAGYSGKRAAAALGLSPAMISHWENDSDRTPNAVQLDQLCTLYDAEWLWEHAPQKTIDEVKRNAQLLAKIREVSDRYRLAA